MNNPRHRIYVVDDNEALAHSSSLFLSTLGWEATAFTEAAACLASVLDDPPDCIVTDLNMPRMSGIELMEALRSRGLKIPVVVVTAEETGSSALARARALASEVIAKPFKVEDLSQAVYRTVAGSLRNFGGSDSDRGTT